MARYDPLGQRNAPWAYDYYTHIFGAARLLGAVTAIAEQLSDSSLDQELQGFRSHWEKLRPLRNVLAHPKSDKFPWLRDLYPFYDRLEYRKRGRDPEWVFHLDDLHAPVERLWDSVEAALDRRGGRD